MVSLRTFTLILVVQVQENANTVTAPQVMAADNTTTLPPTGANPNCSRTTRRPAPSILPKPRKRNNSDHIPVQELHDAHQGLEELSLTHTEHRHREGQMTIQVYCRNDMYIGYFMHKGCTANTIQASLRGVAKPIGQDCISSTARRHGIITYLLLILNSRIIT